MIIKTHGADRNASPDIFAAADESFTSPFFSKDSLENPHIRALLKESPGIVAKRNAQAWQDATMYATKSILTSNISGGMPIERVYEIIQTTGTGLQGQLLSGLFAPAFKDAAVLPGVAAKGPLINAAVQVGLDIALDAISAVPIVGAVINAVVNIAKGLVRLFSQPKETVDRSIPWQEYSRDTDEDLINAYVVSMVAGVDWTDFFAPKMPPGPFTFESATGEGKRVAGVFVGRDPDYLGLELGYMPGTQRMVDVVQVARTYEAGGGQGQPSAVIDAVTNVAEFYPATTQWGTVGWGMVEANSNDGTGMDLYKIQVSKLIGLWENYWGAFFEDLIFKLEHNNWDNKVNLFLAKAIAKFLTFKVAPGYCKDGTKNQICFFDPDYIARSRNLNGFINSKIFSTDNDLQPGRQYLRPDESLTTPALKRLRARQFAALTNSLSCAYVRPRDILGLPAFAAFKDPGPRTDGGQGNYGKQLREECDRARELLLEHPARWKVSYEDVLAVDPPFAQRLKESRQGAPPLNFTSLPSKVDPEAAPGPDPEEPQGGVPFGLALPSAPKKPKEEWSTGKKILAGAALAGAGYLGYKAAKGELGEVRDAFDDFVRKVRR